MKTLNIIILSLLVSTMAMAQDLNPKDVPQVVKNAFTKENIKATNIEWEKNRDHYKVEFDVGRMEHEIRYTSSGEVIKKEQDITEADLPQAIKDVIKSKYAGYRVDDVVMTWMDNTTTYEVELEKGKEDWKVIFDATGNILNTRRD